MHEALQTLHLFLVLDRIAITRLRHCNTDGKRSCLNIRLSIRPDLVCVELDNACPHCRTLEEIIQQVRGKVEFLKVYSSVKDILFS